MRRSLVIVGVLLLARGADAQMPQCVRDPNTGRWISPVEGQACSMRPTTSAGSASSSAAAAADLGTAIGLSIYNYLDAAQKQLDAKLAADRIARANRDRIAANEAARRRDEIWSRLSGEFRFSTGDLELRMGNDSPADSLNLRTGNCFFMDCGERYEFPAESWDVPYVDLRHLRRAAHLARKTLTAAGDERESLIDQVVVVAQGGFEDMNIPEDGVRLPPNALDLMVGSSVAHKLATDARLLASSEVATLQQRRDLTIAVADAVRADKALTELRRAESLKRLASEKAALDAAILAASARVQRAKDEEERARQTERNTLVGATIADRGGPVENCVAEQQHIDAIRAGFPRLDDVIARADALARQERADAKQSITEAKSAGLAVLDPLKNALQGHIDARIAELKGALVAGQGQDAKWLSGQIEKAQGFRKEMEDWAKKGSATGNALGEASLQANNYDAVLTFLSKVDEAGLLSPIATKLAENPAIAARELGPAVALGDAFIRTAIPTADAVLADRRAAEARSLAGHMREQKRHLQSLLAEREARLGEIQRAGGCIGQ